MNTNTTKFLDEIGEKAKTMILSSIASHYGITEQEAYDEVTDAGAEHLLDYMVEPFRSETFVLMQKYVATSVDMKMSNTPGKRYA